MEYYTVTCNTVFDFQLCICLNSCSPAAFSYSSPLSFILDFFFPPIVTLRYQKTDSRFGTTSFNHASLADGRDHHVMLHASGLQRGPPRLNIYVDCRLVHTLDDLPAAFGSLPAGPNKVALRTLQSTGQVNQTVMVDSDILPVPTLKYDMSTV